MSQATALYSMKTGVPEQKGVWVYGQSVQHIVAPPASLATFYAVPFEKTHGGTQYAVWSFPGQFRVDDGTYIGDCMPTPEKLLELCVNANGNTYPRAILLY